MSCPVGVLHGKVVKWMEDNGKQPLVTPIEKWPLSKTSTLPWKTVTPVDKDATYVVMFAYTKFQIKDAKVLNAWMRGNGKPFFSEMDKLQGSVIGYTANLGNIYEPGSKAGCCRRRKVWGEHHAIVAAFKDLKAMRDLYQSPVHLEATKYNSGQFAKCDVAVAKVVYVKGSELPPKGMPGAWSGAQKFIERCLSNEFPRYQETLLEQDDALNVTKFELYTGDLYEEGYFQKTDKKDSE
jgi:hypothetical protein